MKNTVLYAEKDGHKIITGFSNAAVDGVATNAIIFGTAEQPGIIHDTDEWKALEAKKAEFHEAYKAMVSASKKRDDAAYKAALAAMSARQEELKPLGKALAGKVTALRHEKAVCFTPRAGEVVRDASEVEALNKAIQGSAPGTFITLDGSVVTDNRGKVFFRKTSGKWQRTEVTRLGDKIPGDAVMQKDITDEQRTEIESDRVAALPADVRAKEKEKAAGTTLAASMEMRSALEIQGDKDALKKSKKWYDAEMARIEKLYK